MLKSSDRLASISDKPLKLPDTVLNGISEMHERWNNRLTPETLDIAKAYIDGRIGVYINFRPTRNIEHLRPFPHYESVIVEPNDILTVPNFTARDKNRLGHGGQDHVLIYVIQLVKGMNQLPSPTFEYFKGDVEVNQILRGCFYSTTRGFVVLPGVLNWQLGPVVLCSTAQPSQFPIRVIESTTKIVQSVADDKREGGRQVIFEMGRSPALPGFRLLANNNSISIDFHEGCERRFQVGDVMFGPFNL